MEDNFTLCQGVSVGGAEKLRSCCHIQGDNIRGVLSCDIMATIRNFRYTHAIQRSLRSFLIGLG